MNAVYFWPHILLAISGLLIGPLVWGQSADCDGVICIVGGDMYFQEQFVQDARDMGIMIGSGRKRVSDFDGVSDENMKRGSDFINQSQQQAGNQGAGGGKDGGGPGGAGGEAGSGLGGGGDGGLASASFNDPSAYDEGQPKISLPGEGLGNSENGTTVSSNSSASTVKPLLNLGSPKADPGQGVNSVNTDQPAGARNYAGIPSGGGGNSPDDGGAKKADGAVEVSPEEAANANLWQGFQSTSVKMAPGNFAGGEDKDKDQGKFAKAAEVPERKSKSAKDLLRERWRGLTGQRGPSSMSEFGPRNVFIFSGMCSHYERFKSLNSLDEGRTLCPDK